MLVCFIVNTSVWFYYFPGYVWYINQIMEKWSFRYLTPFGDGVSYSDWTTYSPIGSLKSIMYCQIIHLHDLYNDTSIHLTEKDLIALFRMSIQLFLSLTA